MKGPAWPCRTRVAARQHQPARRDKPPSTPSSDDRRPGSLNQTIRQETDSAIVSQALAFVRIGRVGRPAGAGGCHPPRRPVDGLLPPPPTGGPSFSQLVGAPQVPGPRATLPDLDPSYPRLLQPGTSGPLAGASADPGWGKQGDGRRAPAICPAISPPRLGADGRARSPPGSRRRGKPVRANAIIQQGQQRRLVHQPAADRDRRHRPAPGDLLHRRGQSSTAAQPGAGSWAACARSAPYPWPTNGCPRWWTASPSGQDVDVSRRGPGHPGLLRRDRPGCGTAFATVQARPPCGAAVGAGPGCGRAMSEVFPANLARRSQSLLHRQPPPLAGRHGAPGAGNPQGARGTCSASTT